MLKKQKNNIISISAMLIIALIAISLLGINALASGSHNYENYVSLNGLEFRMEIDKESTQEAQKHIDDNIMEFVKWENQAGAKELIFAHDYGVGSELIKLNIGDKVTIVEGEDVREFVLVERYIDDYNYVKSGHQFNSKSVGYDLSAHTCNEVEGTNHYFHFSELK